MTDAEQALQSEFENFVRRCDELENTGRAAEAAALIAHLEMLFALDIARH